ncbi:MAG: hypothetical protein WCC24_09225, partial [Terracidiphilus sp.]
GPRRAWPAKSKDLHFTRADPTRNGMPHPGFARVVADLQTRRLADLPQITAPPTHVGAILSRHHKRTRSMT